MIEPRTHQKFESLKRNNFRSDEGLVFKPWIPTFAKGLMQIVNPELREKGSFVAEVHLELR